jgi:hypothetical protein
MLAVTRASPKCLTKRTRSLRRRNLLRCATKRLMRRRYKLPLLSPELLLHAQAERACGDEASHQPIWNPEVMKCLGAAVDVSLIECCV